MSEFERVVNEVKDSLAEFKAQHNRRLDKIEGVLDKREVSMKKMNTITTSANGYIPSSEDEKAFSSYLRKGEGSMDVYERKSLYLGDNTLGGYTAPPDFVAEVLRGVSEYSPVRKVARIMQTSSTTLEIPKQIGEFTAGWIGEISTRTETTGMTFGLESIPVKEMYAYVFVSRQLLEDSKINLDAYLAEEFGRKLAELEGNSFISGNTTTQPEGILTNANISSANSGDGANVTGDGLLDLMYSVKSQYRKNGSWLMNRATILECRKLQNANYGYFWQPSFQLGEPEKLLGAPVYEAVDMPDTANATYPILFGDFRRGYCIADRVELQILRLVERYAEQGLVAFQARKRVGGAVIMAEAIKKQLIAT